MKILHTQWSQEKDFLGLPVTVTTGGTVESEAEFEKAVNTIVKHFLEGKLTRFTLSWTPIDEDEDDDREE